jgi:hypothetical protein
LTAPGQATLSRPHRPETAGYSWAAGRAPQHPEIERSQRHPYGSVSRIPVREAEVEQVVAIHIDLRERKFGRAAEAQPITREPWGEIRKLPVAAAADTIVRRTTNASAAIATLSSVSAKPKLVGAPLDASQNREATTLVPLPDPKDLIPPTTRFRSTWIVSSLEGLRERGFFDRYERRLVDHRDAILSAIAGVWVPVNVVRAHYEACEELSIPDTEYALMAKTGSQVRQAWWSRLIGRLSTRRQLLGVPCI